MNGFGWFWYNSKPRPVIVEPFGPLKRKRYLQALAVQAL
jgi:hypothetical protein